MAYKKQLKDKDGNTIYPDVGLNLDDVVYSDDPEPIDDYIDPASYSTTEANTGGTWIDGKPIYRKVISKTFTSGISSGDNSWAHNIANISEITSIRATFNLGWDRNTWGAGDYLAGSGYQLRVNKTNIILNNTTASTNWKGTITVVVEYTKTTD